MHGVQTEKLRYHEEQEERSRKAAAQKILPFLQKAHRSQGIQVIPRFVRGGRSGTAAINF